MKRIRRWLAGALLLACSAIPGLAAQGSGCLPITGLYSGVAYTQLINAAFAAGISTNSGVSPPATDCSGGPVLGQFWFDTSTASPGLRIWDGSQGLLLGRADPTNHIWMPSIGGGLGTLAAASVTDLCSVPQGYVTISGATTINGFGSSCAIGQIKALNFSSVLAVAYSLTGILLPTAASITTQAGDQAVAAYTGGGIWQIVSYTRADGTALTATTIPPVHYAGETIMMRSANCPAGSRSENGNAISRTTFAALFAVLGTTWGAGDGSTTFNIPDASGVVDRGWNAGQTVDPGRVFGTTQADQIAQHTHTVSVNAAVANFGTPNSGSAPAPQAGGTVYGTSGVIGANFGNETRMKNITVFHCIFTANSP